MIIFIAPDKALFQLKSIELFLTYTKMYAVGIASPSKDMDTHKKEAHGPRVAHLSDIATADMQMLCNIFPILSLQLMKRLPFKQFLILKKNIVYGMTVNGT